MKVPTTTLLFCAAVFLSGCGSGFNSSFKRTGYQLSPTQNAQTLPRCSIAIQCYAKYSPTTMNLLGHSSAYDTGFSLHCDEAYVLDVFCKEACALGADLVIISDEKQPDQWSSCYRAKADFVSFKDRSKARHLLSDSKYAPDLIISRSEDSKERSREKIAAEVRGGILGSLVVMWADHVIQ